MFKFLYYVEPLLVCIFSHSRLFLHFLFLTRARLRCHNMFHMEVGGCSMAKSSPGCDSAYSSTAMILMKYSLN